VTQTVDIRQRDGIGAPAGERLRVAMLAPPWIPVPPSGYGGIEAVVDLLCSGLIRLGHAVTLFAAPGSRSHSEVVPVLEEAHPEEINHALYEADHVATSFGLVERARERRAPFDVVHDHCGFTALAMADRLGVPLVHTVHGPFTREMRAFYARHAHRGTIVGISRSQLRDAPPGVEAVVVPNPIEVRNWPFRGEKEQYLLWIGRMAEEKGAHRAIEVARLSGMPLVLAGPVQPGQEAYFETRVAPCVDGRRVRYVGEVGGTAKQELFARARALLMPIRWSEPFGLVMVEALACGTPVIAFAEGAAVEIVLPGQTGFLVGDEEEMAAAVRRASDIDPARCRALALSCYDTVRVAASYVEVYRRAIERHALAGVSGMRLAGVTEAIPAPVLAVEP
jgi:glycosyltransferase involved in cell wall biosynthesis